MFSKVSVNGKRIENSLTAQLDLFKIILLSVFVLNIFYGIWYYSYDALALVKIHAFVAFLVTPMIWLFEHKKKYILARLFVLGTAIVVTYLGFALFKVDVAADLYFIPIMLAPLLLFEARHQSLIIGSMVFSATSWLICRWGPVPQFPEVWYPQNISYDLVKTANTLGVFVTSIVFVKFYVDALLKISSSLSLELQRTEIVRQQLNRAQGLAKIGSWRFFPKGQEMVGSPELLNIYQIEAGEEVLTSFLQRTHPEDLVQMQLHFAKAVTSNVAISWDYRILLPGGEVKYLYVITEVELNSGGEVDSIFGTAQDVTELRGLHQLISEQQMRLVDSARLAALGEMAGGIAHEINNPLMIVVGKTQQLIKGLSAGRLTIDQALLDLEKILKNSQRINKIISGMRSISRNGEQTGFSDVYISDVVEDVLGLCSEKFALAQIEISTELPVQPIKLEGSHSQIGQVLLNLLNNSFDSIEHGAEKWVKIVVLDLGNSLELKVTDSGRGISEAVVKKMFQPFFTSKEIGKGTGLGLSISLRVIEGHNGTLRYEVNSSHTCFVIKLPKNQPGISVADTKAS